MFAFWHVAKWQAPSLSERWDCFHGIKLVIVALCDM